MSFCTAHPWTSWVVILFDSWWHIGNNSWTQNLLEFPNISKRESCRSHYSLGPPYAYSPSCVNWSQFCRSLELYSLSITFLVKPAVVNVLWYDIYLTAFQWFGNLKGSSENSLKKRIPTSMWYPVLITPSIPQLLPDAVYCSKNGQTLNNQIASLIPATMWQPNAKTIMTLSSWPHWVEKKDDSASCHPGDTKTVWSMHFSGLLRGIHKVLPWYNQSFNNQFPLPFRLFCCKLTHGCKL